LKGRYLKIEFPIILMISFVFFIPQSCSGNSEFGWEVKVWDKMNYTILSYYDASDRDGDGDFCTMTSEMPTNESNLVNITYKIGFKYTVKIISLEEPLMLQIAYDEFISQELEVDYDNFYIFFRPTINNQTYWEAIVRENNEKITENNGRFLIENDLFVQQRKSTEYGLTTEIKIKYNWKTGWLMYFLRRVENSTSLLDEYEFSSDQIRSTLGFSFVSIFGSIILTTVLITRYRKNR
jgi:hypothetical protein